MIKRLLLPLVIVTMLLLVGMNVAMGIWSHRLPYFKKLEMIRNTNAPNLIFIGNSLLDGRIDAPALAQTASEYGLHFQPLNAALGASEAPEHRMLFNYAVRVHPDLQTVVVGFYDFQLTAHENLGWSSLFGNRMVSFDSRFSLAEVNSVYGFDRVDRAQLRLARTLPMLAHRHNIWKYIELLRRRMGEMGMPAVSTNSMGRASDFAALEDTSPEGFDQQAQIFLDHPDHFNASYENILDKAHRRGMRVVLLVMPMSPYHRSLFYSRPKWKQYMVALKALARARGICIIDGSNWMNSEGDFADHLHMTLAAAPDFSTRLGSELATSQK